MPCASGAKRVGGGEREKSAKEKREGCRLDGENNVQVLLHTFYKMLWLIQFIDALDDLRLVA